MGWRRVVLVIVAVIVVEIVLFVGGGLIVMYGGLVNVAATNPDPALMDWALGTISDQSAEHHSAGIAVSPIYKSPDLKVGYDHYHEMCVVCHGAPGVSRGEAGKGLNPEPPLLYKSTKDMTPSRVFWVIKNGIKMTGMPAWGVTHDDEKLWQITAFVKHMTTMTPEEYAAMGKGGEAGGHEQEEGDEAGHEAGHSD